MKMVKMNQKSKLKEETNTLMKKIINARTL